MNDLHRLHVIRFLDEHAPKISKTAFKELVVGLHCLGCLSDAELETLFRRHLLKRW